MLLKNIVNGLWLIFERVGFSDRERDFSMNGNSKKNKVNKRKRSAFSRGVCLLTGFLVVIGMALLMISRWYDKNYEMSFKELLYTLLSPLEGTGEGMINEILGAVLPAVIVAFVIYVAFEIAVRRVSLTPSSEACNIFLPLQTTKRIFSSSAQGNSVHKS